MKIINILVPMLLAAACSNRTAEGSAESQSTEEATAPIEATWPIFNADSAYAYVDQQVKFGPRVPGTESHRLCREYLTGKLKSFGADTIILQQATVEAFNGKSLPMTNILARFNTKSPRRILIAAHYDTRPWADEETDESKQSTPIDGANDGASGVGVILELARNLQMSLPEIGVDFLLTDVEDYGSHDDDTPGESSWALGAQYWAANPVYTPTQRPAYGILLDMVGGRDARFYREYFSEQTAGWLNTKVWTAAATEGIGRFKNEVRGGVTDDHIFITRSGIPCIDIIECANDRTGSFPPYWHTTSDNMENIDRATLGDVGRTLMRVIYSEKAEN